MFNHYEEPELKVVKLETALKVACLTSVMEAETDDGWEDIEFPDEG